jgi:hypothetical protein
MTNDFDHLILPTFISFLLIFSSIETVFAQVIKVDLIDEKPKYQDLVDISMGPDFYFDNPKSNYEAGSRYRVLITRNEIYEYLYLEYILLTIEGTIQRINWTRKIDMLALVDKLSISLEQMIIENIQWRDDHSFFFDLGDQKITVFNIDQNSIEITASKN